MEEQMKKENSKDGKRGDTAQFPSFDQQQLASLVHWYISSLSAKLGSSATN